MLRYIDFLLKNCIRQNYNTYLPCCLICFSQVLVIGTFNATGKLPFQNIHKNIKEERNHDYLVKKWSFSLKSTILIPSRAFLVEYCCPLQYCLLWLIELWWIGDGDVYFWEVVASCFKQQVVNMQCRQE